MNSNEAEQMKRQLIENIESSFSPDKAAILKRQIMSMSDEQLEGFMEKSSQQSGNCIFCSIGQGNLESHKIDETDSAVAVLEINPISRGHTIVISKEHLPIEKFSKEISVFAKKVADELKEKLAPHDVEIATANLGGHGVINLIPVYKDESINSKRYKASKEELDEVMKILKEKPKEKKVPVEKIRKPKIIKEEIRLPKRIP